MERGMELLCGVAHDPKGGENEHEGDREAEEV